MVLIGGDAGPEEEFTFAQGVLLGGIRFYQRAFAGRPSPCRFWPTCSHYAAEAIEVHGAGRGFYLSIRRLIRCRPFGPSGFDPVPLPEGQP
jgi:putative membrane protein insertion efficiency factor